ncbi:amidohydrolase family protein [Mumia sp. DW29H23]|uniref:amidohydrolase family protein n=1 Tax=Mumia sp. DW29H23 TaxID=3421241 RepID=UPI003D6808B0
MATWLPPFVDHHVHLQLVDADRLRGSGLAGVVDLGGDATTVAALAREAAAAHDQGAPYVRFAGAFLAAPGGYPGDRSWCPAGAVREVRSPADAAEAVAEQAAVGATTAKVTLNADAGPVPDRATLTALVDAARDHGLPVVAHVEGPGTTALATAAGIDVLAHTPWTEQLDEDLVRDAARQGQRWITTLDIHGDDPATQELALDNLRRFHAAGGRVLYGTDLGNGDLPLGVNPREIAAMARAGLDRDAIVSALADPWPTTLHPDGIATRIADPPPARPDDLPAWLASAEVGRRPSD